MKTVIALMAVAALVGCSSEQERADRIALQAQLNSQPRSVVLVPSPAAAIEVPRAAPVPVAERFSVVRVQIVKDLLAYSGERGVYVIKDNLTGAEYVGVSGVGITELGRQYCGKACSREVER